MAAAAATIFIAKICSCNFNLLPFFTTVMYEGILWLHGQELANVYTSVPTHGVRIVHGKRERERKEQCRCSIG